MKYICLGLSLLLAAVNVILLWQMYRRIKTAPGDSIVADLAPYLVGRLTAFGINTLGIALLFALYQLLTMLGHP